uniref:Uncharacterized protein n=1 Tax=Anguilla anguilla TaxID=7936 RepID=A0A0E9VEI3_ANGAN
MLQKELSTRAKTICPKEPRKNI